MVKALISYADWQKLEKALMDARVGYEIYFDDHNGTAEMIIDVQRMGVYRYETPMMDEEVTI
jgi:hypothetical protein